MKRKLKFISIIALILAITISFSSSCFAVETENENSKTIDIYYNDKSYTLDYSGVSSSIATLSSIYNNYVVFNNSNGVYALLTYQGCFKACIGSKSRYHLLNCELQYGYIGFKFDSETDTFVYWSCGKCDGKNDGYIFTYDGNFLSSNYDVLDEKGEVVFQKTPVGVQSTLAPIVQEAPLEGTVQEIVGILPIVLITLIGLIGLRKVLALLSQTLHKA